MDEIIKQLPNYGLAGIMLLAGLYGAWHYVRVILPQMMQNHREQITQLINDHRAEMTATRAEFTASLEMVSTSICDRLDKIDGDVNSIKNAIAHR